MVQIQTAPIQDVAFPRLTSAETAELKKMATVRDYADGETIFHAGQASIDLYVVESGHVEISNPIDGHRVIVVHEPGEFSGDIDLLTGRPVMVSGLRRENPRALRSQWPNPRAAESLAQLRRKVDWCPLPPPRVADPVGPGRSAGGRPSAMPRHQYRPRVSLQELRPFRVVRSGKRGRPRGPRPQGPKKAMPAIECSDGRVLSNPTLQALAIEAGIWRCVPQREVDFAIVGAGRRASPRPSMRRRKVSPL